MKRVRNLRPSRWRRRKVMANRGGRGEDKGGEEWREMEEKGDVRERIV